MLKKLQSNWPALAILATLAISFGLGHVAERWITPPTVEAQGAGSANFTRTFSLPASASPQYIPACTATGTNCIPNYKQIAHSVTMILPATPTLLCASLLDFSADGTNFLTLASGQVQQASTTGTLFANGYEPYIRIKVLPCNEPQTVIYTGYSTVVPTVPVATSIDVNVTGGPSLIISNPPTPLVISGFNCLNTGSSVAYGQLFLTAAATPTPTLGTGIALNFAIPANGTYTYPGALFTFYSLSLMSSLNYLWLGAATGHGGGTGASSPIDCTFTYNGTGPYYPFNPPSS